MKELDKQIAVLKIQVKDSQQQLAALETKKQLSLLTPKVSDHAVLRYLQRKYNLDIEGLRKEILSDAVIGAINAGANAISVNNIRFTVKNKVITTSIK